MSRRHFEPISAVLPDVLLKAVEAGISARALAPLWAEAVGPQIAAKTNPLTLRAGELTVEVRDQQWLDELSSQRTALLSRLQARLGRKLKVSRITFRTQR